MTIDTEPNPESYWFVGASYGGGLDQTPRFLGEGIWENRYDDKYLDLVRSMRPGDRIAIKSSYTRKHDLPFDNRGNAVSVMAIKAIGTITDNRHDGKHVRVDWTKLDPPREWYFYTHRGTAWRVMPGDWTTDGLLAFAFEDKPQDVDRFRNAPYWRERYGPGSDKQRFRWTEFYEAIAEKLLDFQSDRTTLVEGIHVIASRIGLSYLQDKFADGGKGPLKDICPFTAMGIFNRSMTDANRKTIATEMATLLSVDVAVPESFEGIPVLNNQRSWFFSYSDKREEGDIDALWTVFAAASRFLESERPESRAEFAKAYDDATEVWGVAWNLSAGLYWSHPWDFATLDSQSRNYTTKRLRLQIPTDGQQGPCNAETYLKLLDDLKARFSEESYPVHSFPELSLASWLYKDPEGTTIETSDVEGGGNQTDDVEDDNRGQEAVQVASPLEPYSVADLLKDGCFLERGEIERLLERLRTKKNLILQGPPGTGKTWIARRLAFALMGEKDDSKVRALQFHPNLSYEDFVRGWRPTGDGKLALADGVFMEAIQAASRNPTSKFVVVIEEINRGNPAQIFGELLTLLEAGKRTPNEALELCYPDADGKRRPVHVPENLYVIGTMNIADRSLALVDLAFRRRFAFATLEPKFGDTWRRWVVDACGVDPELVRDIERRITDLNQRIADDLGSQFRIGHSYVTPTYRLESGTTKEWFKQAAETEIGPLLEEYWFDSPKTAKETLDRLIEGW